MGASGGVSEGFQPAFTKFKLLSVCVSVLNITSKNSSARAEAVCINKHSVVQPFFVVGLCSLRRAAMVEAKLGLEEEGDL